MKNVRARAEFQSPRTQEGSLAHPATWMWVAWAAICFLVLLQIYGPSMEGPFLFDDEYLPFTDPGSVDLPWLAWLKGVRPVLMLSYWLNYQISQTATFGYHFTNVVIHLINGVLVAAIIRKLLRWLDVDDARLTILPLFAATLFLLHPVQTEAVAYIAGRSDGLSTMFYYGALTAFLYRKREAVSWVMAAVIAVLFGLALMSKEQAITLPVLLALTDFWWHPESGVEGVKRNWRLYAPLIVGALAVIPFALKVLATSKSAGSAIKEFTWQQYLFTQFEVIWNYVRLFLVPVGQNGDYDFPIARSLAQAGVLLGLTALVASVAAAWIYRKRFPLATYGWLMFLLMLTPTSSVLPILDPIVERRLYLPSLGLLLILTELLLRVEWKRTAVAGAMAVVLAMMAFLTYQRTALWSDAIVFWSDVVKKSPGKWRAHFQLAYAYLRAQKFAEASTQFEQATRIDNRDPRVMVDWGLALDGLNQWQLAVAKMRAAVAAEIAAKNSNQNVDHTVAHTYTQIALVYGKQKQWTEAMQALDEGQKYDPNYDMIFAYRGNVLAAQGQFDKAKEEFSHALALNPANVIAQQGSQYVAQQTAPKQ